MLADERLISGDRTLDGRIDIFQITPQGFEEFAKIFMPNFAKIIEQTLHTIVTQNLAENKIISERLGQPQILIDYSLYVLASRRFIAIVKTVNGGVYVDEVTVRGRRAVREQKI